MSKKLKKIKITVLLEGQTEKFYLEKFKNTYLSDEFVFEFINLKTGNYSEFSKKLEEYKGMENIVFVVVDLDKAENNQTEKENLKKMCKNITYINNKCNIFLTCKNFETFLSAHFENCNDICKLLKIDKKDIKNNENIYDTIIRNGGKYENTLKNLSKENLCYHKIDSKNPTLNIDKIQFKQSGLILLQEYCQYLKSNWNKI